MGLLPVISNDWLIADPFKTSTEVAPVKAGGLFVATKQEKFSQIEETYSTTFQSQQQIDIAIAIKIILKVFIVRHFSTDIIFFAAYPSWIT